MPYALIQFAQRNRLPHKNVGVVQVCVPVGIAGHQDGLDPWKELPHRGIVLHKLNASSALLAAIISYPREDKYSSIALRTLIHLLQAERSLSPRVKPPRRFCSPISRKLLLHASCRARSQLPTAQSNAVLNFIVERPGTTLLRRGILRHQPIIAMVPITNGRIAVIKEMRRERDPVSRIRSGRDGACSWRADQPA